MNRSVAIGIVGSGVVFAGLVLGIALSTVITTSTPGTQAVADAKESMKSAIDAPSASAVPSKKPAAAKLATPSWIWARKETTPTDAATLVREFTLDGEARAVKIVASIDNLGRVLLDDREIAKTTDWAAPAEIEIATLAAGKHTLMIQGRNDGGPAGAVGMIEWTNAAGARMRIVTDESWKSTSGTTGASAPAVVMAKLGDAPWGDGVSASFGAATVTTCTSSVRRERLIRSS